ncbi:type I-B CRISPR-associated protein Cas8b/Csh1, partial [Clostridium paraputrificum]|nr:type I-B CRISPR-associated protein Cas8b/Csh1 [Clostridium paraputrificum]
MLKDCLEIFKSELDENGDKLILDEYTLSDGTYIIVTSIEDFFSIKEVINIKFDKKNKKIDKSNKYYEQLCFYDYN